MTESSNTELIDTLYGGLNGQMHQPDYFQEFLVPDSKPSLNNTTLTQPEDSTTYEIIPTEEVAAAILDDEFDIRPRVYDARLDTWVLVDTGSMVSCLKPTEEDVVNPNIKLETVDGSSIRCYGRKDYTIRLGRKEFHINAVVTKTTDTIL